MLLLLLLLQVKIITRRAFDAQELSGPQLSQLMHGLARMPKYAPNAGWLAALCERMKPLLQQVSLGAAGALHCCCGWYLWTSQHSRHRQCWCLCVVLKAACATCVCPMLASRVCWLLLL